MSFWDRYEGLCNSRGIKPASDEMEKITGVSSAAISGWKNKGSQPKLPVIMKIANYFQIDHRYLLGFTDSLYGEDLINEASDKMIDNGADIHALDNDNGVGKEYVITYNGQSQSYQEHIFKNLCEKLFTKINDAESTAVSEFLDSLFDITPVKTLETNELSKDEIDMLLKYRSLNDEGKTIVRAALIQESRRME